jgi:hypothetical protein
VTVALYQGSAEIRSAGRPFAGGLPALRQLSITATGQLPREAVPLVYDQRAPDPWDLRFIGDAIDLGIRLDGTATGFTGQLGPRALGDASMLRRVLPPLAEEDALDGLVDGVERSPGESLVGASIVLESGSGSFADRWGQVFSFREDGARWGLVALDQQVKREALLARINDAFGRSPLLFAIAPRSTTGGGSSTGSPEPGGTTSTTTRPGGDQGGGDGDGDGSSPPTTPPTTLPPPLTIPPTTIPLLPGGGSDPPDDTTPDQPDDSSGDVVDTILDTIGDVLGSEAPPAVPPVEPAPPSVPDPGDLLP